MQRRMKIVVCPDKFKGSLTAAEVCNAVVDGIRVVLPDAAIVVVPLADGGEGTCALLTQISGGSAVECEVTGPLFHPVRAVYGISRDGSTAYIEMAAASGLALLSPSQRDPRMTTTLGTGELIRHALDRGVDHVVLGLGGSATNDGGIGMASALGYQFLDRYKKPLNPVGASLIELDEIKTEITHPRLKKVKVTALCDVTNPLYGSDGAAWVYSPQKGADEDTARRLDEGLRHFSTIAQKTFSVSPNFPGAGAAGGLGYGARLFLKARMEKGFNYMIEATRLKDHLDGASLVITGEGRVDEQTLSGKVVVEVAQLAKKAGIPTIAICGSSTLGAATSESWGLQKVISLVDAQTPAEVAVRDAAPLITQRIARELKNV